MKFINNMIDRRKVWNSLLDYPVYSPPFRGADTILSKEKVDANYDYFLEQKEFRLDYLANYMAPFEVDLRLAEGALPALDRWFYRYSGHLMPNEEKVIPALYHHEPAWMHGYHGLNVINDISIFLGDYIISKYENVHWGIYYGTGSKDDYEKGGLGQACLFGLPHSIHYKHCSIFWEIFLCCDARHRRLTSSSKRLMTKWDTPGALFRWLDYLSNANSSGLPFGTILGMNKTVAPSQKNASAKMRTKSAYGPTRPRYWYKRWRMQRALKDYPLYDPPHKKDESRLSRTKADENLDYFTSVLDQRVAILRNFLAKFDVDLDFSERALRELNDWFFTYGGFMIHELIGTSISQFKDYDPPWTKEWAGFNTLFDLGIFLGEYARNSHNTLTYWMMGPGTVGTPKRGDWNFQRPILVNFPKDGQANSPFRFLHSYTSFMRQKAYRGGEFEDALRREDMSVAILEYMAGTMGQRPAKKRQDYNLTVNLI